MRAVGRPYPGAFTTSGADRLVIWAAEAQSLDGRHLGTAGQVVAHDERGFLIRCGDGAGLRVLDWDLPSGGMPRLHARLGQPCREGP